MGDIDHDPKPREGAYIWLMTTWRATLWSLAAMSLITIAIPFTWGGSLVFMGPLLGLSIGSAQQKCLKAYAPHYDSSRWLWWSFVGSIAAWLLFSILWISEAIFKIVPASDDFLLTIFIAALLALTGAVFGSVQLVAVNLGVRDRLVWVLGNIAGSVVGGLIGLEIA